MSGPPDCVFCRILSGRAPGTIVHRDDLVTAFRDRHPVAPTHILVVPNRHVESLDAATEADEALLGRLFTVARALAHSEGLAGGYRIVVNTGRGSGQSVFHLHLHLLGGRGFSWPPG